MSSICNGSADPEISPDGRSIAYVRMGFDIKTDRPRGTIWLVGADGKNATAAVQRADERRTALVAGRYAHRLPRARRGWFDAALHVLDRERRHRGHQQLHRIARRSWHGRPTAAGLPSPCRLPRNASR